MVLDQNFWNLKYAAQETGWDLGEVSPPIKEYINQLKNKNASILIPGCGNTYEAEYLIQNGFTNITILDIAPLLTDRLKEKFKNIASIKILLENFFDHQGAYDLILEQTFFCALHPSLRAAYVSKMKDLLQDSGKLVGVLFNKEFDFEGPPFGGKEENYQKLFQNDFEIKTMSPCYNSVAQRQGTELFINLIKK